MPFDGVNAREAMATIWSFVGWKHEIIEILQKLSQRSRAYLYNANGLRGFALEMRVMRVVKKLAAKNLLDEISKWQCINLDELEDEIKDCNTYKEEVITIAFSYPALFLYLAEMQKKEGKFWRAEEKSY